MSTTLAQFHKQIVTGELKSAYLIAGEEPLLLLEAADALRMRAKTLGCSERIVLDAESGFDWNELIRNAQEMSLFATRKLIDLRLPTGKPGKEGSATIIAFLQNPPSDVVLLVTCTQWSKQHEGAWTSAIEKAGVFVPIWPIKVNELPAWIESRMNSRGLLPDLDAIALLAERVEGNLLAAAQEIDKLVLLKGKGKIDAKTLEMLVADSARYDAFRLTDAACLGDTERALHILQGLRSEGEQIPGLLGWILNQLQLLLRLSKAGNNLSSAFRSERVWPARENLYRKALNRAKSSHWEQCLVQAAKVDRLSKGRGEGDAWLEMERLLTLIAKPDATKFMSD